MHRYLLVSDLLAALGSPRDPPVIRAIFPFSEKSFDTSTLGVSESGMLDEDMNANGLHEYSIALSGSGVYSAGPLKPGGAWVKCLAFLDVFLLVAISYQFLKVALHFSLYTHIHHAQRLQICPCHQWSQPEPPRYQRTPQ